MSKYTESFEDWFDTEFETKPASYKLSRYTPTWKTWNHQQSKINELLERLKECEESLLFYANNKNLHGSKSSIIYERCEVNGSYCLDLGNRAGLYFKKYEGKQ